MIARTPFNKRSAIMVAASFAGPFALLAGFSAMACSAAPTKQDPGVVREENLPPIDTTKNSNPQGIPYPTADLGVNPRGRTSATATPGNRIANLKFLGYPSGNVEELLKTVAMADFFDPKAEKYSLIHIQAAGTWCTYCKQEAREFAPEVEGLLANKKVLWLTVVVEGINQGKSAVASDLDKWISLHKSPNPHAVDTNSQNLGVFFASGGLPWNATIDARSMEILATGVGYAGKDGTNADLTKWLDWQSKNPPRE
jgi:thiol-disulfide isomerase/thioredoxin